MLHSLSLITHYSLRTICPGAGGRASSFPFWPHRGHPVLLSTEVELAEGRARHTLQWSSSPGRPAAATATHVAEDHGLSNGDGPVEVTQGLELLISVTAQDVILLDGVQRLLLTLQFDNVWVWDHFLGKFPHRVFKGGREKQHLAVPGQHPFLPLDADALVLVALSSYHHVSLIQNKHLDLLRVDELELGAPVQNSPRGANDNVFTDLLTSFHCGDKI
uniref:Uncharacterized protein n=1 Tax=Panthera tigris altaica TaxID=74533 RepID=A0A8C9J8Q5_PANTA